jgi:hypothetical protein
MRALVWMCFAACLAACNRDGANDANASLLTHSGGEVALADGSSLQFAITSDRYKQWDAAQRGITKRVAARFGAILRPDAPTERSINSAVSYLAGEPSARQAIENAGLTVRDFVVMTVMLEQEMRLASGKTPEPTEESKPYDFPPVDTTFIAPQPAPAQEPLPVDTALPIDTAFIQPRRRIDTVTVPPAVRTPSPTIFRRDTARRDTLIRRDTTPPRPVTPDTVRDTTRAPVIPPDTLPPA